MISLLNLGVAWLRTYKEFLVIGHCWDQNLTFTCLRRASLSTRVRNKCWFLITSISTFSASFPNRVHLSLWYSSSAARVSFRISLLENGTKFLIYSRLLFFSVIWVIVIMCRCRWWIQMQNTYIVSDVYNFTATQQHLNDQNSYWWTIFNMLICTFQVLIFSCSKDFQTRLHEVIGFLWNVWIGCQSS